MNSNDYAKGLSDGVDLSIMMLETYKRQPMVDDIVVQECIDWIKKIRNTENK